MSNVTIDPVPEVDDLDVMFPSRYRELLPRWDELTDDEKARRCPHSEVVSQLFFKGGRPADLLEFKPGVDPAKVVRYLKATLGDFGPKHEHKIGGIAHMLKKWTTVKKRGRL